MSKKPIRKDVLLILILLLAAAALYVASVLMPRQGLQGRTAQQTPAPDTIAYIEAQETLCPTGAPEEMTTAPLLTSEPGAMMTDQRTPEPAIIGPVPQAPTQPVAGYVVLTVSGRQYGDAIPMDRDKIITIKQEDGKTNRIHITPNSAYMESSTCRNQDCVGQGVVTLDNLQTRILGAYVICLPNEVTIEVVPAQEDEH